MRLRDVLLLSVLVIGVNTELFSLIAGTAVAITGGTFWALKDTVKCSFYECCHEPDVHFNAFQLAHELDKFVFGQHLVKDTVVNALRAHWGPAVSSKPLVLSFHGYTGCGKNFVAEIVANNSYRLGMRSNFVHHIVATTDFPDKSRMDEYKLKLRDRVLNSVRKCQRSLFIFDETDKLPERLLASIKPFLDYYSTVSGVDFRRSVFIFLSNRGGSAIAELTNDHHEAGLPREQLVLADFERRVMDFSYNEDGGLKMSELISNHLIDHFVPFLPLQREHVQKCIVAHLKKRGRKDLVDDAKLIDTVLGSLQYFPDATKAFSSSGCKRVDAKTDLEVSRRGHHYHTELEL